MKSVRRLLVAFYGTLSTWLVVLAVADARNLTCNPDEPKECDALGEVLLAVSFLLPVLLFVLLVALCATTVGLLRDMSPSEWIRQAPVIAVLTTVALLAILLAIAIFGNLEGLL